MSSHLSLTHPLVFVRHGETLWNRQQRFQGTTDVELSSRGSVQAQENAALIDRLAKDGLLDVGQMRIISSPLSRAYQTAEILSAQVKYFEKQSRPIASDAAFRELSMGVWEGLTSMEVKQRFYEERKRRKLDRWNFVPTGGESMESRSPAIKSALEGLAPHSVVVTHSGVMRIILQLLSGSTFDESSVAAIPHRGVWFWNGREIVLFNA